MECSARTFMLAAQVGEVLQQDTSVVCVDEAHKVLATHGAQTPAVHVLELADVNILQLVFARRPLQPLTHVLSRP